MQNLIANAVKFHAPGAQNRVTIRARRHAEHAAWLLSVSDDGIGIGVREQERIFEVFRRLNPREDYDGTGVGLAICRLIAERHGGNIEVRSAPGEGCNVHREHPGSVKPSSGDPRTRCSL